MKKLAILSILSITIFSCKYDYNCSCLQNDIGVGSKAIDNVTRKVAESECNTFMMEVVLTDTLATCEIIQNY